MTGLQRDGNLREGPVTSPDRDDRIGGLGDNHIPGVSLSCADNDIQVPVPVPGIRHNTDCHPALFLCPLAGCFHYAGEPAADKGLVFFRDQKTNGPGSLVFFC